MACETVTMTGVTGDVWECLLREARLRGGGIPIPTGTAGVVTAHGFTVRYDWSMDDFLLRVTVEQKPPFVDCAHIATRLRQIVRSCGGD